MIRIMKSYRVTFTAELLSTKAISDKEYGVLLFVQRSHFLFTFLGYKPCYCTEITNQQVLASGFFGLSVQLFTNKRLDGFQDSNTKVSLLKKTINSICFSRP